MKPASAALLNYLNGIRASADAKMLMADAYKLTLASGTIVGYTNIDVSFAFGGVTYLANSIRISGLKYKQAIGLEVDKQQIEIIAASTDLLSGVPFLQALRNRALDGARIARYRVFFSDTLGGTVVDGVLLFAGRVGQIDQVGRTTAKVTV